jgi:hypothetical protein
LAGCSPKTITKIEYVYPEIPAIPERPEYLNVPWAKQGELYCLSSDGAKAIMINFAMKDGRERELETILKGLAPEGGEARK